MAGTSLSMMTMRRYSPQPCEMVSFVCASGFPRPTSHSRHQVRNAAASVENAGSVLICFTPVFDPHCHHRGQELRDIVAEIQKYRIEHPDAPVDESCLSPELAAKLSPNTCRAVFRPEHDSGKVSMKHASLEPEIIIHQPLVVDRCRPNTRPRISGTGSTRSVPAALDPDALASSISSTSACGVSLHGWSFRYAVLVRIMMIIIIR